VKKAFDESSAIHMNNIKFEFYNNRRGTHSIQEKGKVIGAFGHDIYCTVYRRRKAHNGA
jgi:hypothetical protein